MASQSFRCRRWVRYMLVASVALALASCSRSRSLNSASRRRVPLPTPPSVSEGPDSELPLSLPPSDASTTGRTSAAYGLAAGVSVAPAGSTGTSRDLRYPRSRESNLKPIPMPPPGMPSSKKAATAEHAATSAEIAVKVPSTSKKNGPSAKTRSDEGPTLVPESEQAPGIPGFFIVKPDVATGGQPTFEGMQWLKDRGFRTVLNLLPEPKVDPAEASMVRQLGLEYISLPVTARSIDAQTLERFSQIAIDIKNRPLFIHDSAGSLVGALWYLHRVTVDKVPDAQARSQSARIGLKDTDTELWLAIQRYLSENN